MPDPFGRRGTGDSLRHPSRDRPDLAAGLSNGGYYTYKDDFDTDRPWFGRLGGRVEEAMMPSGTTVLGKNVGKEYRIIQNRQSIELATEIAGLVDGGTLIACGLLDAGVRFFGVIELPDQTFDTAKHPDRIGSQLIVHTGHDGGTSCSLGLSRTRFFCTDQLAGMLSRSRSRSGTPETST